MKVRCTCIHVHVGTTNDWYKTHPSIAEMFRSITSFIKWSGKRRVPDLPWLLDNAHYKAKVRSNGRISFNNHSWHLQVYRTFTVLPVTTLFECLLFYIVDFDELRLTIQVDKQHNVSLNISLNSLILSSLTKRMSAVISIIHAIYNERQIIPCQPEQFIARNISTLSYTLEKTRGH